MKGAVLAMLGSKKAVAAMVGMVVALAAKVGLDLEVSAVMTVVGPVIAYVVAQGIADNGKEAAKVANGNRH